MMERLNTMDEFEKACNKNGQDSLFELFKFEMIGDESEYVCAIVCTDKDGVIHECEVYTEYYVYVYDTVMKTHENMDVLFDIVITAPRNPEI